MSNPVPTSDFETPFTDSTVAPGTLPGMPGYVPLGGAIAAPGALSVTAPNGAGPLPPSAVPIVPPPEYGPAAPDPTDAITVGLPPAQPGIPTRDQDQEVAPAVPREAPGNVGTPGATNAQAPDAAPGTAGDVKDKLDAEAKARGETAEALGRIGEDEQDKKDAQAQAAAEAREEAQKHIATAQAIQDQYDKADKATQDQIGQMRAARQNFKLKDYWADKSGFQHAISALGVALGAFGSGLTKTPNYALQILDKKMDDDHRNQVDQLNKLSDDEMEARTGLQDSQKARALALANVDVGHADRLKLVAAKLEERSATADDVNYKNTLAAKAAELRQKAAASDTDAAKSLRTMNLQDQQAALAGRKEKSEEDYQRAQEEYLKEHGQYFAKGGAHQRGTGGGAGSSKMQEAETKVAKAIEDRKAAGTPMSLGEMQALADDNHLPHEAKPGHPSLMNIISGNAKLATTGNTEKRGDAIDETQFLKQVKNFEQQNNTAGMNKMRQKFAEARTLLKSGNGMGAMAALMEADGAARGAQATESSMHALQEHSGGAWDRLVGAVQRGATGDFGEEQKKNIASMIDAGERGAKETQADARKRFHGSLGDDERAKKAALGIFGSEEATSGGALATGARKKQGGHVYEFKGGDAKNPSNWAAVP